MLKGDDVLLLAASMLADETGLKREILIGCSQSVFEFTMLSILNGEFLFLPGILLVLLAFGVVDLSEALFLRGDDVLPGMDGCVLVNWRFSIV